MQAAFALCHIWLASERQTRGENPSGQAERCLFICFFASFSPVLGKRVYSLGLFQSSLGSNLLKIRGQGVGILGFLDVIFDSTRSA